MSDDVERQWVPGETIRVGEERDRLDERLDELADAAANDEPLGADPSDVEQHYHGVCWLAETFGEDATVRLQGLTAGDYARVEDHLARAATTPGFGTRRNAAVASALQAAPFLPDDAGTFQERAPVVSDLPVGVVKWLHDRAQELTSVGRDEGNGFDARRKAAQSTETSTATTSSE